MPNLTLNFNHEETGRSFPKFLKRTPKKNNFAACDGGSN